MTNYSICPHCGAKIITTKTDIGWDWKTTKLKEI